MISREKRFSVSGMILLFMVLVNVVTIKAAYTGSEKWYSVLIVTMPLLLLAILNVRQQNFRPTGYARNFFESVQARRRRIWKKFISKEYEEQRRLNHN